MDLQDEIVRAKRILDEKHYESNRLNDESAKKSEYNLDMRDQAANYQKEIDSLKMQRADNWREIQRLKDDNDAKTREAADQADKQKVLDYDLSRT